MTRFPPAPATTMLTENQELIILVAAPEQTLASTAKPPLPVSSKDFLSKTLLIINL